MEGMFFHRVRFCFDQLYERLEAFGFDVDLSDMTLSFPVPDQKLPYLLKVHALNQEIWLSSPLSGGHRFAWYEAEQVWRHIRTSQDLDAFLQEELATLS